jgi:hypothetical protein
MTPQKLALELLKGIETGEISLSTGSGIATGDDAPQVRAEKIIAGVRQQLPPSASGAEELAAVLRAARGQLVLEGLDPVDRDEAEETVEKIEKEMARPEPNKDRVGRWVESVEKVSAVVGQVIRRARAIGAIIV